MSSMTFNEEYFHDFLWHYEDVNVQALQTAPPPLQYSYVVLAHIEGVLSTSAFGVTLKVRDHTGTASFVLRGETAWEFYEEHLRRHASHEPRNDPFALNGRLSATYLFRINSTRRITVNAEQCFDVSQICMHKDTIDQFCLYIMEEQAYQSYQQAIAIAVQCGSGNGNNAIDNSINQTGFVGPGVGSSKRIYAPYSR